MDELEITPADVKERLDRGEKLVLIDVRELGNTGLQNRGRKTDSVGLAGRESTDASRCGRSDLLLPPRHAQSGRRCLAGFQGIEKAKSLAAESSAGRLRSIQTFRDIEKEPLLTGDL